MKLIKKYIILELLTFIIIMLVGLGCESDNCRICTGCLLETNEGTYCESDFDNIDDFNQAIGDLEFDNCTCN